MTSTPGAPEQFGGADGAEPETDVYALGVVAYQALTGRLSLTADDTRAYVELHRDHAPVPALGDDLPPALDRAVRGALQRHRQARTPSALALADDLRGALRASPRGQLRTSAQQWLDDRRPRGLLWGADVLEETLRSVPPRTLSELEWVAPVTVGRDAYVGAGTTVTKDVPRGSLALTRVKQVNVEGWADRFREAGPDRSSTPNRR